MAASNHHHGQLHGHHHVHQHTPERLEQPERVRELNPTATLERLNFGPNEVLCDIGAGSGLFTLAAARISPQVVYALDINPSMLKAIAEKAEAEGLHHIELRQVIYDLLPAPDHAADLALVATVLHEIPEKPPFIAEIRRLLKPSGRLAVIEFHAAVTPMGPPVSERLGREEVTTLMTSQGFTPQDQFDLGRNLYCLVFSPPPAATSV
ncbi:MAG: methyltransferase domain-containing protein [Clostridia bacterium]|nr:methyltransferase domain-containing protein [Clostridia bacterium]